MEKEQYLTTLLQQIRCKRAHEAIEVEVEQHIDDQIEAYLMDGMDPDEACKAAVADMGDPVEAGSALDKVHRPVPAIRPLLLIALFCALGLFLQYTLLGQGLSTINGSFTSQAFSIFLGILLMTAVYLISYTHLSDLLIPGSVALIVLSFIALQYGTQINGVGGYLVIAGHTLPFYLLLYLYIPLFGALLFRLRNSGYTGLLKAVGYMLVPLSLALFASNISIMLNLLLIFLVMLTTSICKNWFNVSRKFALLSIGGIFIGMPTILLFVSSLGVYAWRRISALYSTDSATEGYIYEQIHQLVENSGWFGGISVSTVAERLPAMNSNYVFTCILANYGILASLTVALLLLGLFIRLLTVSLRQVNQLGMIIGCGCGTFLLLQTMEYFLHNLGISPIATVFLPFLSYGAGTNILCFLFLGLLLSIYRYQNVLTARKYTRTRADSSPL